MKAVSWAGYVGELGLGQVSMEGAVDCCAAWVSGDTGDGVVLGGGVGGFWALGDIRT